MESEEDTTVRANIVACMGGVRPFFFLQNLLRYLNTDLGSYHTAKRNLERVMLLVT